MILKKASNLVLFFPSLGFSHWVFPRKVFDEARLIACMSEFIRPFAVGSLFHFLFIVWPGPSSCLLGALVVYSNMYLIFLVNQQVKILNGLVNGAMHARMLTC